VIPARRKQRPNLSSILSKNEMERVGPGNRKLFRRAGHGQYLLNAGLTLSVGNDWRPIYDLLVPERLAAKRQGRFEWSGGRVWDPNPRLDPAIEVLKGLLLDIEPTAEASAAIPGSPPKAASAASQPARPPDPAPTRPKRDPRIGAGEQLDLDLGEE
jgi:hypothetical protein